MRREAFATAAVASLCFGLLIALQFNGLLPRSEWPWVSPWASKTPGYLIWVVIVHFTVFFLTAFLSSSIADQLRSTKASLWLKEQDYRKLSGLHSSIVHSIPSGIITTDEFDRVTYVNDSGATTLRSTFSELLDQPLTSIFPEMANGLPSDSTVRNRYVSIRRLKGEAVHLELTVSDLRGDDDLSRGRLVVFQDVTAIKRMEEHSIIKVNSKRARKNMKTQISLKKN